jgi:ATP-dependent RNA helicase DDX47/RRP3
VELYQRIEQLIGKQLPLYKTEEDEVMVLQERVAESQRIAKMEMKDLGDKKGKRKRGDGGDDDDTEGASGVRKYLKGGNKKGGKKK